MKQTEVVDAIRNLSDEHIKLLFQVAKQMAVIQMQGGKVKELEVSYRGVCE